MRIAKLLFPALVLCLSLPLMAGTDEPKPTQLQAPDSVTQSSFDQIVDRATEREKATLQELRKYSPVVETYIQNMRPDNDLGFVPASDTYFLGRMDLSNGARRNHRGRA